MDDTQADVTTESREGRLARKHKAAIASILEELVDAMEAARADGFMTEFGVNPGPEGAYAVAPGHPALIKRW